MSNFHPLEVVRRDSGTQLQVGENVNFTTLWVVEIHTYFRSPGRGIEAGTQCQLYCIQTPKLRVRFCVYPPPPLLLLQAINFSLKWLWFPILVTFHTDVLPAVVVISTALSQRWANISDTGPTLSQHCANVSSWWSRGARKLQIASINSRFLWRTRKHKTSTRCWLNVGPPSTTLAQH